MRFIVCQSQDGSDALWIRNFERILTEKQLPFIKVHLTAHTHGASALLRQLTDLHQVGDVFLTRVNQHSHQHIQPIYGDIVLLFGEDRVFPDHLALLYYDDKRKQNELFRQCGYPIPHTEWVTSPREAASFSFPVVRKDPTGASSENVRLVSSVDDVQPYPCLLQQFIANNTHDMRVNIVGHRAMGFSRRNRKNDFRASGSGQVEWTELPRECLELAYRISRDHNFACMAYDFVFNHDTDQWVLLEMSYTFVSKVVQMCNDYYDMADGGKLKSKRNICPEQFLIEDILAKVTALSK